MTFVTQNAGGVEELVLWSCPPNYLNDLADGLGIQAYETFDAVLDTLAWEEVFDAVLDTQVFAAFEIFQHVLERVAADKVQIAPLTVWIFWLEHIRPHLHLHNII